MSVWMIAEFFCSLVWREKCICTYMTIYTHTHTHKYTYYKGWAGEWLPNYHVFYFGGRNGSYHGPPSHVPASVPYRYLYLCVCVCVFVFMLYIDGWFIYYMYICTYTHSTRNPSHVSASVPYRVRGVQEEKKGEK